MIKKIGSQSREKIEDTEYEVDHIGTDGHAVLFNTNSGYQEMWSARDDYAGYVVEIDGVGYEFCYTIMT